MLLSIKLPQLPRTRLKNKTPNERNVANVDKLKERYPDYFEQYVNFNAVLHNRSTVDEVYHFIKDRYGKKPQITALNTTGIRPEKKDEFNRMFRNVDLKESENYEALLDEMFMKSPEYYGACLFLQQYNKNVYRSYNDLFASEKALNFIPTGGCVPFSRKMFITVNGKILACERIGQQYGLGTAFPDDDIELSYQSIADLYNNYFDKLRAQCKVCYMSQSCIQCMFNIDRFDSLEKVACPGFANKEKFGAYVSQKVSFIEQHPESYERVMEVVLA